jgi:cation transport ATPase
VALQPQIALLPDGRSVPAERVEVGQVVSVRPGERVPVDGVVVSGASLIDQVMRC